MVGRVLFYRCMQRLLPFCPAARWLRMGGPGVHERQRAFGDMVDVWRALRLVWFWCQAWQDSLRRTFPTTRRCRIVVAMMNINGRTASQRFADAALPGDVCGARRERGH
jgi:hypothetical protein